MDTPHTGSVHCTDNANEKHEYFVMARMYHVVYIVYGTDTINAHRY